MEGSSHQGLLFSHAPLVQALIIKRVDYYNNLFPGCLAPNLTSNSISTSSSVLFKTRVIFFFALSGVVFLSFLVLSNKLLSFMYKWLGQFYLNRLIKWKRSFRRQEIQPIVKSGPHSFVTGQGSEVVPKFCIKTRLGDFKRSMSHQTENSLMTRTQSSFYHRHLNSSLNKMNKVSSPGPAYVRLQAYLRDIADLVPDHHSKVSQ